MPKGKAGRPRNQRPHEIAFVLPLDVDVNLAKRSYWYLLELEKKMSKDITSVPAKSYFEAVEMYGKYSEALKRKGKKVARNGKVTNERVQPLAVDPDDEQARATGADQDGQVGVGVRVSADNPLT